MIKIGSLLAVGILSLPAYAATTGPHSPVAGVLCDKYICADEHGLSVALTTKYVGKKQGDKLAAAGQFDTTSFTFGAVCSATPLSVCAGMTDILDQTVNAVAK